MVDIIVSANGCRSSSTSEVPFKCQMCYPANAQRSPRDHDACVQCARSKIKRGMIYYYYQKTYEKNLQTGKKELVSKVLVEKWKDD